MPLLPTRQRRSVVLILALLLMGAIIGSTIALSTIIADSTHQSQTLNDFIAASLTADSGLERGLAVVKAGRRDQTLPDTITAIATNGANYTTTAETPTANDSITRPQLRPGEVVSFDILNIDASGLSAPLSSLITVNGSTQPATVGGPPVSGQAVLDISWIGLDVNGEQIYSGRAFQQIDGSSHQLDLMAIPNIRDVNGNPPINVALSLTRGFRIRITAASKPDVFLGGTPDDSAANIKINSVFNFSVTGGDTGVIGFPSRINITSTGKVNNSQSQKTASVLWQLPASPLFNYVLFTEGDIIPGTPS